MICYSATHNQTGKRYIGVSDRDLATRKAEHESHSACGISSTMFHLALRKHGKENFTWKILAEGDQEIIKIIERVLIGEWRTLHPRGFNSINEASELERPFTDDELGFFQTWDTHVAEMEMAYDLHDILNEAMKNKLFNEKTKELIRPLIDHVKSGNCFSTT